MMTDFIDTVTDGFEYDASLGVYLVYVDGEIRAAARDQSEAADMYEKVRRED